MNRINKTTALGKMLCTNGRFFTVTFVKKDGELRKMNCRLNVSRYTRGGTLSYNPLAKNMINVYDMKNHGYRMVNFDTVKKLIIDNIEYDVL